MNLDELIAALTELRTDDFVGRYRVSVGGHIPDHGYDIAGEVHEVEREHADAEIAINLGRVDWMQS